MKGAARTALLGAVFLISSVESVYAQGTPPWLDVELGGGVINRSLTYHQDISARPLLPYYLPAGPILIVDVVAYPHGPSGNDATSNLGFEADLQQGIVSSQLPIGANEARFDNSVHDFAGGVRYRFAPSTADEIFISATYGEDAFTFSGPNRGDLAIPDTIYRYLRSGIGARVGVGGGLSVRAALGYRALNAVEGIKALTNAGGPQMEALFPRLVVSGADADVEGDYAIDDRFAIRLGVGWRRYWYSMNSRPGDASVAGGAIDQSFVFTGAIALTIGQTSTVNAVDRKPSGKATPTLDDGATGDGDASEE
jgi:hypothetical protein